MNNTTSLDDITTLGTQRLSVHDNTGNFSPITLCHEWPALSRLLILVVCAFYGTFFNGFFVAAFFVDENLKRLGNVYLACVGLSDLIFTSAVVPVSAVALLSRKWDNVPVCRFLQFLTEGVQYAYSLLFIFVGGESYFRLCRSSRKYRLFLSINIRAVVVVIFILSFTAGFFGVYLEQDYDYCQRLHYGNFYFRIITFALMFGFPFIITFLGLLYSHLRTRSRADRHAQYRRSPQYKQDLGTVNLNIASYLTFVCCWAPYIAISHEYPSADNSTYYSRIWLGVFHSIISNSLYLLLSSNFRRAFSRLFNYCCCKSTSTRTLVRHRRGERRNGDVRVHIMHQAFSKKSPQPGASAIQETQDL